MAPRTSSSPVRILLAEDDAMTRRSLSFALIREGYSVQACPDGISAWQAFTKASDWSLLLTDMEMPGLDGLELARRIRSQVTDLPVLILTGHDDLDAELRKDPGILAGCLVVTKPYRLETLLRQVVHCLGEGH